MNRKMLSSYSKTYKILDIAVTIIFAPLTIILYILSNTSTILLEFNTKLRGSIVSGISNLFKCEEKVIKKLNNKGRGF